jgi:transcriptional antiterminator NusG
LTPTGLGHRVEYELPDYVERLAKARKGARGLFLSQGSGQDGWIGKEGWYAVQTMPRNEKAMVEKLIAHKYEAFTPIEKLTFAIRNGRGRTRGKLQFKSIERAYFPGYIFVRLAMCGRLWRALMGEDGILGIVSVSEDGLPTVVPDSQIAPFRNAGPFKVEQTNPYKVGDVVRPTVGPFAGVEALIHKVDRPDRIGVFLSLFGQSVPTEFEIEQVERVASRHSRAPA